MKSAWAAQGIALLFYFVYYITEIDHNQLEVSNHIAKDSLFVCYHALLFLFVNYVLLKHFFVKRRLLLFFILLFVTIVFFGAVEEGIVEKILYPTSRGVNDVTWQSIYYFFQDIFMPLAVFVSLKMVYDNFEKQQALDEIQKNSLSNELKFLKSQIQPHVLFNSLNNLYEYTLDKSDKAPDLVLRLSSVLRYVLYETQEDYVSLRKELSFIQEYIELHEIQLEGRGIVRFEIAENAQKSKLRIAPFLLIPFLENSFKHSIETQVEGIQIVLQIQLDETELKFQLENNFGAKNTSTSQLTTGGIGLENVKKRLELLYPEKHKLNYTKADAIFKVDLELNLD